MSICTSQSMTLTTILPNNARLARINPVRLSSEAKFRLRFIEHYLNTSKNASETCRLFGIARSLFYKWYNRYDPYNLSSLENKSSKPHKVRSVSYSLKLVSVILQLRQSKDTALYSAHKIALVLKRDYPKDTNFHVSAATVGRIIKRFKLFFSEVVRHVKKRKTNQSAIQPTRKRKPAGIHKTISKARQLIRVRHEARLCL